MYFKVSIRKNPETGELEGYYRLVESYRNEYDRICHRTLLNVGFLKTIPEKLNVVQKILNDRLNRKPCLFEETDTEIVILAERLWKELLASGKIDASDQAYEKKRRMVDANTLKHKDVREIGAEWMCYQALEQLKLKDFLHSKGWDERQIQLAYTQIISRAVYPCSENRTVQWVKENSAVCEVTGYPVETLTKDKLYEGALKLLGIKDALEQHLSVKTNELFDLDDRIILYDLTNTYFEGTKPKSKLAQHTKNKSKEKRDDAKIVVLGMVINMEGFIKFSGIFEGKKSDSGTLPEIVDKLRRTTSSSQRGIVVLDAGIATEDNLRLLESKGYDYVCVSRSQIRKYEIDEHFQCQKITTKANQTVILEKVKSPQTNDYIIKVASEGKKQKETSMNSLLEGRFKQEIQRAKDSLSKKGGIKRTDKVERRIGRIIEKYPSIAKHFDIKVMASDKFANDIQLQPKESYSANCKSHGTYFIRTNLKTKDQTTVWKIYNSIREVESSFRCLKTELNLRPVYHKNDRSTVAHLHLAILAYWLVNTIRYQLKNKGIGLSWQEIVRIANTQKIVTTIGQNTFDEIITVRRCSEPSEKVKAIYHSLDYKFYPFVKRKFVVHKSEFKKFETVYPWYFSSA